MSIWSFELVAGSRDDQIKALFSNRKGEMSLDKHLLFMVEIGKMPSWHKPVGAVLPKIERRPYMSYFFLYFVRIGKQNNIRTVVVLFHHPDNLGLMYYMKKPTCLTYDSLLYCIKLPIDPFMHTCHFFFFQSVCFSELLSECTSF